LEKGSGWLKDFIEYYFSSRHSVWKTGCDTLTVMGLHENWILALRCQVSGVSAAAGLKSGQLNRRGNFKKQISNIES
jgi:hypothetical protein